MLPGQTVESMEEDVSADSIAEYVKEQDATEIAWGMGQIAAVVQTKVAVAEESAAGEELSGQAAMLRKLVAKFRLKDG